MTTPNEFQFDVLLSHSSKDKPVVCDQSIGRDDADSVTLADDHH